MLKIISKLLTFAALFSLGTVQAHIFMIEKWSNGSQDLYCLHDYHVSSELQNKIGNQQQIDIVDAAKKHNAFVITEDALVYSLKEITTNPLQFDPNQNDSDKISKDTFNLVNIPNDQPPIFGLTSHCHYAQIPVDNVEFRQVKIVSLCDGFIPSQAALIYPGIIRKQIMEYNDEPALNDYYKKKIDQYLTTIKPCINFFDQLCNQNCSLKEALALVPYDKQLDTVQLPHVNLALMNENEKKEHIITHYDTTLMDLRIIHSIYTHIKHNQTTFLCAGSGHVKRIEPALKLMGFELVDHYHETHDSSQEPKALNIADYFKSKEPKKWSPTWLELFLNLF